MSAEATAPTGRGRGGRGGGGTWVRAIPGTYTVTMNALGQTVNQPAMVRMDPRITVSADEMRDWHRVGNYSGRPTRAQSELIATYAQQTDTVIASLEAMKKGTLASLRAK
jgi:hypothetical protein